ncbi:MAG: nitroreductase family protein [Spirochaetes bacterium]|nr:nitroreductase family protein [Spirochaetota bacterium]
MDFDNVVNKRRSFRSLEQVQISDNDILQLAKTSSLAPSCYNNQPWRYIFVRERNKLNEMFDALSEGNAWAKSSSMIIVVYSKKELDCAMKDGRDYYKFDTGISCGFLMLKAAELGFVAHPIAGYDPEKVKRILDIESGFEVLTLIIVGKHSEVINPVLKDYQIEFEKKRPERKKIEDFIKII